MKNNIKIVNLSYSIGEVPLSSDTVAARFNMTAPQLEKWKEEFGMSTLYHFDYPGLLTEKLVYHIHCLLMENDLSISDISGVFGSGNPFGKNLMPTPTTETASMAGFTNIKTPHVGIGCAGGVAGIHAAYNQLFLDQFRDNKVSYYLVIGGEDVNVTINQQDFKTGNLFSDAGYAILMTNDPNRSGRNVEFVDYMSLLTNNINLMTIPNPLHPSNEGRIEPFKMDGTRVYQFGIKLWDNILHLTKDRYSNDQLRDMLLIPHQANRGMILAMALDYGLNLDRVYVGGVEKYANTSNASPFVALKDNFNYPGKLLVAPFGAELQVGVIILNELS